MSDERKLACIVLLPAISVFVSVAAAIAVGIRHGIGWGFFAFFALAAVGIAVMFVVAMVVGGDE